MYTHKISPSSRFCKLLFTWARHHQGYIPNFFVNLQISILNLVVSLNKALIEVDLNFHFNSPKDPLMSIPQ